MDALAYTTEELEDNLVVAVMKWKEITTLVTRNPKKFLGHELEVYKLRALIDLIEKVQKNL